VKSLALKDLMRELPEVVRIPFEDAVKEVRLQGWEDEWFSTASFDSQKHGKLLEPKIDFVYNCKLKLRRSHGVG
jgi:hypothetical protein